MSPTLIKIPVELNEENAIDFLDTMWAACDNSTVVLDFTDLQFVKPFGTLILAEGIKEFVQYRKDFSLTTKLHPCDRINNETSTALSYLRYFNFFEYTNAPCGFEATTTRIDSGYIPIQELYKKDLIRSDPLSPLQNNIELLCRKYADSLVKTHSDYLKDAITYCYREIIRNTFEHAEIDRCSIMAQNWERLNEFEIALIDKGIGILGSIQKQNTVKIAEDALDLALKPGISGKTIVEDENDWGNSGFGLYILSELGNQFGSFSIYSSGVFVHLCEGNLMRRDIQITGTGIKLHLNLNKIEIDYFPNIREGIVQKGEQIAENEIGLIVTASKKSRTL
jgi:hypothetical protein